MGPKKDLNNEKVRIKNKICHYYDRGFCKFGDTCYNKHPDKVCNSHVTLAYDDGKLNALEKKFTKKLEVLENQLGKMKKLLDQKNSEINDIKNKNNDMDKLLKDFQSRTGKIEERMKNETVVELKNEI